MLFRSILCVVAGLTITTSMTVAQLATKLPAQSVAVVTSALSASVKDAGERAQAVSTLGHPFFLDHDRIMVRSFFELVSPADTSVIIAHGGRIRTLVGRIVTASVPVTELDALCRDARITRAQLSARMKVRLDESVKEIKADKVHLGEGLSAAYTGKGVIIGVFDTGIDAQHPDFRTASGSRIMSLWDMSATDGTPPAGFTWGREYTKTELDNAATAVNEKDFIGHGTHVAGIAAGGGRANAAYKGVAPDADLVIVKGVRGETSENFADDDIVAGCQYIFAKAKALNKQAVINLSLGGVIGPHDGTELTVQALDGLIEPGHLIVVAAGNEGDLAIHAGGPITSTTSVEALIAPINVCSIFENLCNGQPNEFMTAADIWYTANSVDTFYVAIYGESNIVVGKIAVPIGTDIIQQPMKVGEATVGYVTAVTSSSNLPNGSGNIFVQITNKGDENIHIDAAIWSYAFHGAGTGQIDLWAGIPWPEDRPIFGQLGTTIYGNTSMTIGTPATGKNMISVGSYVTKNEWESLLGPIQEPEKMLTSVSTFSSKGPTRDGRMAPTVGAPGETIFSAMTSAWTPGSAEYDSSKVVPGGSYVGMRGTSMAAPHVAGVIALMMEAKPGLTLEQVRTIFDRTSRHDGSNPDDNNVMGYGKIDALEACIFLTTDVAEAETSSNVVVRPNPARDVVSVVAPFDVTSYDIIAPMGTVVATSTVDRAALDPWSVPCSTLPSGMYMLRLRSATQSATVPLSIVR